MTNRFFGIFFRNNSVMMTAVLAGAVTAATVAPGLTIAQTPELGHQRGSSRDAFARAGEALRRGLAKPQKIEKTVNISEASGNSVNSQRNIRKALPNPLAQLASYSPPKVKNTKAPKKEASQKASTLKKNKSSSKTVRPARTKNIRQATQNNTQSAEINRLKTELARTKEHLAIAELEVSRLSDLLQGQSFSNRTTAIQKERARLRPPTKQPSQTTARARTTKIQQTPPQLDMQVATISTTKAHLRLGPGTKHSRLMTLRKGSRLAVETRQGEWYRVFAPNGQRAWIHASLVSFGTGSQSLNDGSSVSTEGFNARR